MRTNRHNSTAGALALALTLTLSLTLVLTAASARPAAATAVPYLDLPGGDLVPTPAAESLRIVINVPARKLHLVEGERLVASYPVAVGRPATPTPRGSFRILQMAKDPTWAPKGGKVVLPGPHNPLGTRWMRITSDGYGIHATNDPASIGHARSHGCIRMHREDAEAVFAQVQRGTRVDIVYELDGWDEASAQAVRYPDLYAVAEPAQP
jgi:lipoprotein-anchoring transpeptidase ErfK/SrfK